MKYTYGYFKGELPEWKKEKDPFLSRIFYRKVSFFTASLCANFGISANVVSYASAVLAIVASGLFLINNYVIKIIAAILINVWLILDCTDGDLARTVKSQPFGEFADGISSYILVGLMCTCMGFSVYQTGGILFHKGSPWIILIGALASSSDTLMRLIYQKYKATEATLVKEGIIKEEKDGRRDQAQVNSIRVRIESDFGIGGILPMIILIATIFNAIDLAVLYCLLYYGLSCICMTMLYVIKAIKYEKDAS